MKTILFADTEIISTYKGESVKWYNTESLTVTELLEHIEVEQPKFVFIYGELLLQGESSRSKHNGIDLIKHIRLTPLKDNLHNLPIVLFHWLPVEHYIESDLENLILFSSGIKRIRLPFKNLDFDIPTALTENISPFLFHSESDEKISEHQFRNEIAISQFETESVSGKLNLKDKPIWYKKLYYQQGYASASIDKAATKGQSNSRLLLIDDLGDKWKPALQKVLPNASIEVCKNIWEAETKIDSIQKQIKGKRKEFIEKVSKLSEVNSEINNKQVELKTVLDKINAERNKLTITQNKITKANNDIHENNIKLQELLVELTKNGGIIEALLFFKTENINTDTKKSISCLSQYITNISNAKESLKNSEQSFNGSSQTIESLSQKESEIANDIQKLKSSYRTVSNNAYQLFESLYNNEVDLILLDMHLTKDSEGKEYKKMDGYKVLTKLRAVDLKIPVMIFSATRKNLTALVDEFIFLQKNPFLKGMTPVSHFVSKINDLERKAAENRLISVLDEVMVFQSYKFREYQDYDSPQYETKEIFNSKRTEIINYIRTIKTNIENYIISSDVSQLKQVVVTLGRIQRDYRFKVIPTSIVQGKSLLHITNISKNMIGSSAYKLHELRNSTEHYNDLDAKRKKEYDEWLRNLDIVEIEKHLKTVYEGLIFDK